MGVIKKLFFRDKVLGIPRHRNFFLDMEENIHIHYRDLRIELSRGEFEDICNIFRKQSLELQAIIEEKKYQDGKLANANQDDVRIWTESRLSYDVKYNPQRVSIEECSDGFHIHVRNYKLLLNEEEFRQLVKLFKNIDVDSPPAQAYDEVLALLEANELDFSFDVGNVPGEVLALAVAKYHLPKIRDVLSLLGFSKEAQVGAVHYLGQKLKVVVREDKGRISQDYRRLKGFDQTERLVTYLTRYGAAIEPNELNQIKCQVLDLYHGLVAGESINVDVDLQSWLYAPGNRKVIFPYCAKPVVREKGAAALLKAWDSLVSGLHLWFIKPDKRVFARDQQEVLAGQITQVIQERVSACPAVEKVYLMGSALRGDMGVYHVPFVLGPLVKLGSDVDILIELDQSREGEIFADWQLIKSCSSNFCAIYHVAQIPLAEGVGEWGELYPHLPLLHHLVDAYVFFPSRGHAAEKDAFLKKFNAKKVFDRAEDKPEEGEEDRIAKCLAEMYGFSNHSVEKMKVSTENALYQVVGDGYDYVLKIFKVAGNYKRDQVVEHTAYEEQLVCQIRQRGVLTAGIIPAAMGGNVTLEGYPALLFDKIHGEVQSRPEYPIETIAAALARIHGVQIENPLVLTEQFSFENLCSIWLPCYQTYLSKDDFDGEIMDLFAALAPIGEKCLSPVFRQELAAASFAVHNHGDVKPKNVIIDLQGQACFFDFNNAYFGPRMADVVNGGIEFALAEKYIHLADFSRFDSFIAHYSAHGHLTDLEVAALPGWLQLMGIIWFTKEIRVVLQRPNESLRRKRAIAIAGFVLSREKQG